jgi:hypothetical protein
LNELVHIINASFPQHYAFACEIEDGSEAIFVKYLDDPSLVNFQAMSQYWMLTAEPFIAKIIADVFKEKK